MPSTITIEMPVSSEALVRCLVALNEERLALALAADGTVFDACESGVLTKGRDRCAKLIQEEAYWLAA
jgi:hypothetical protein